MRLPLLLSLALLALAPAAPARADSLVWAANGTECTRRPPDPACSHVLWRADADGANARVVGGGPGDVLWPQWSRDGGRMVFHRQVDETPETIDAVGRYEIFSAAGDGSGLQGLTDGGDTLDMQPAVSPDGRYVAWWRSGFDASIGLEVGGIWVMRADGTDQHRLVDLPGDESTPDFSADGQRVAFTRNRAPGVDTSSVWSVRRDGTDLRQLSTGDMVARVPKFSPDGRHVSFFSGNALVVMALDGTAAHEYPLGGNNAAWSSDGRYLAVLGLGPNGQFSLYRIDVRRPDAPPLLVRDLSGDPHGWLSQPGWVADGSSSAPRPDDSAPSFVVGLEEPVSRGPVLGSLRVAGGRRAQRPLTVPDPARLRFTAADRSGLQRVQVSITGAGKAARFHRLRNRSDWRRLTRSLRRGTYTVRVQARDERGNVRQGGRAVTLRVR